MAIKMPNKQAAELLRKIADELVALGKTLAMSDSDTASNVARQAGKLDYIAHALELED